jgi:large subunit ribosomal protein L1
MPIAAKELLQAVERTKVQSGKRNFTQSIEMIINLRDIDLKKTENRFQELVELPYAVGKKRLCIIASGEMALNARKGGAELVLQRTELENLTNDKKRLKELANLYDFFIAEASLMPLVGRVLGATLGPRGKMPTPVSPTADISELMEKHRKMVLLRLRNQPVIQCKVGKETTPNKEIVENVNFSLARIEPRLKRGIKSISSIYLKSTMGSPVKVKL